MNTIWMIASGTFGEAMRRKILLVFLFVALALIVMGFAFASFTPGREMIVIKSLGPGRHRPGRRLYQRHPGINLIPNEIERRTIYTHPVQARAAVSVRLRQVSGRPADGAVEHRADGHGLHPADG